MCKPTKFITNLKNKVIKTPTSLPYTSRKISQHLENQIRTHEGYPMGKYSHDEPGGLGAYQVGTIRRKKSAGTIVECDKNKSSYPTLNFVLHALHSSQMAYHRAESCNACVMRVIPVMRAYAVCNTKKKSAKPFCY